MGNFKISHYKIYDRKYTNWWTEVHNNWVFDDMIAHEEYRKEWISITSVASDDRNNDIYLGIGSFANELLWKFNRQTKEITSMGYEKIADKYDGKFHRSLELDYDGSLYAGIALFHDLDKQFEAKGGKLIKYNTKSGEFTDLGIPAERIYIQSIALDKKRKVIYGFGATPEVFWKHDLKKGESKFIAYIGNSAEICQAHCPVIDDKGRVWGTYGIIRAFEMEPGSDSIRLFNYDPDTDKMEFLNYGLPSILGDKGKPDTALNGGDGYLYFGTVGGSLVRLNPENGEIKLLGKPCTKSRMGALARSRDGLLYGIAGECGEIVLFSYDTKKEEFIDIVPFYDKQAGISPERIHNMVITDDNVIYAGENDNNTRSSYLWECIIGEV